MLEEHGVKVSSTKQASKAETNASAYSKGRQDGKAIDLNQRTLGAA